jgi:hypothetical protein
MALLHPLTLQRRQPPVVHVLAAKPLTKPKPLMEEDISHARDAIHLQDGPRGRQEDCTKLSVPPFNELRFSSAPKLMDPTSQRTGSWTCCPERNSVPGTAAARL